MNDLTERLLALLEDGRWRKIDSGRDTSCLTTRLGASHRDVEAAIEEARLSGNPIIGSSLRGVKLTNDPDELAAYVAARRERLVSIYAGNRALRKAERRMRERVDLTLGLS